MLYEGLVKKLRDQLSSSMLSHIYQKRKSKYDKKQLFQSDRFVKQDFIK